MRYLSKGEWASNPYPGSVCMCAYLGCPQHGHMQLPSPTLLYLLKRVDLYLLRTMSYRVISCHTMYQGVYIRVLG